MKIKFQCTLMTDVILNMKSASEGNNNTHDFIPGNVFLGIVASKKYVSLTSSESSYIFHSGKVRFGDAHPDAHSLLHPGDALFGRFFYPRRHPHALCRCLCRQQCLDRAGDRCYHIIAPHHRMAGAA